MNSDFYYQDRVTESIEAYCKEHQIKESDFAKMIEVVPTQLSRIKTGKSASYEALCRIALTTKKDVNFYLKPISTKHFNPIEPNTAVTY